MNYAELKNERGESIDECVARLRYNLRGHLEDVCYAVAVSLFYDRFKGRSPKALEQYVFWRMVIHGLEVKRATERTRLDTPTEEA